MSEINEQHTLLRNDWGLYYLTNIDISKLIIIENLSNNMKILLLNELFFRLNNNHIYFSPYHEF